MSIIKNSYLEMLIPSRLLAQIASLYKRATRLYLVVVTSSKVWSMFKQMVRMNIFHSNYLLLTIGNCIYLRR